MVNNIDHECWKLINVIQQAKKNEWIDVIKRVDKFSKSSDKAL